VSESVADLMADGGESLRRPGVGSVNDRMPARCLRLAAAIPGARGHGDKRRHSFDDRTGHVVESPLR